MVFHSSAKVVENAFGKHEVEWCRRRKNNILMQMLRCLHTRYGELKTNEFGDEANQRLVESGMSAKLVGNECETRG